MSRGRRRGGEWGPLSLCLPVLPLPGGLKVPPSRAKGGGGTRPPSNASLGDKCHLHHLLQRVKWRGERCREGRGGTVSPWEEAEPPWRGDTNSDHRALRGHRGAGH